MKANYKIQQQQNHFYEVSDLQLKKMKKAEAVISKNTKVKRGRQPLKGHRFHFPEAARKYIMTINTQ